ncbi:hypothetical protein BH11PAT1_BH11PAT1_2340 [soil metagenome]
MPRETTSPGITQSLTAELAISQIQEWQMAPFTQQGGIEVLDTARRNEHGEKKGLEKQYKRISDDILTPPFDEPTIITTIGRSGIGKGNLSMGYYRLLKNDEYLAEHARRLGIQIELVVIPFALYQTAANIPRVKQRNTLLQFATPFSDEHYKGVAQLEWEDIEKYIITSEPGKKKIGIIESASYTSFPMGRKSPVKVMGVDRGNSPVYNAALDSRTSKRTFFNVVERDDQVTSEAGSARNIDPATASDQEIKAYFGGDVQYVFTRDNEEVNVATVSIQEQRAILRFLTMSMAPPSKMKVSDRQVRALQKFLNVQNDKEYHNLLRKHLEYEKNDKRFSKIVNSYLLGSKTYDLDYLRFSLPAILYPEILTEVLR